MLLARRILSAVALVVLMTASTAHATFPGQNWKIAVSGEGLFVP
jgi:hypothetical protein